MNARESILARIQEALRVPAPRPEPAPAPRQEGPAPTNGYRRWLPAVGGAFEDQRRLFAENALALKADFQVVTSPEAAAQVLRQIAEQETWKKLASHKGLLTSAVFNHLDLEMFYTDEPYPVSGLEQCDAGLTECEALVAQTGSVLITSRSAGGRALSVLPPHHVVLATKEQLIPDLPAAFALLRRKYEGNYPSCMSFITGPSRTGDIERILVLGAHGPKKLTILLLA
jgi:L-lactate dehydrogenase complex protein LldG